MSNLILNLGDAANWQNFYFHSVTAVTRPGLHKPDPIPEFTIPLKFNKHIIAVSIISQTAKSNWYFGGFLNQRITTGLISGNLPDSDVLQRRKLYLNRISILIFPTIATTFTLSLEFPKWFTQASFNFWQYTGPESDTTETQIAVLQNTVNAIKLKTDKL